MQAVNWKAVLSFILREVQSHISSTPAARWLVCDWEMRLRRLLAGYFRGRNVTLHRSLNQQDNEWSVKGHIWSPLRSIVEVNLCQHNGNKPRHVKSAVQKQDLKSIVFQHAWRKWGNLLQMSLMTPHRECMCLPIDDMPAALCISIKPLNGGLFYHCWCFDCSIDLFQVFNKHTTTPGHDSVCSARLVCLH